MDPAVKAYAGAIYEIAKAEDEVSQVQDELFRFARILQQQGELRMALTDATRSVADRQRLLSGLLEGRISKSGSAALALLLGAGQIRRLDEIVDALLEISASERESAPVEIVSATELSADQVDRLVAALSKVVGKKLVPHVAVDPSLLGGLVARVGDEIFDGSIKGKLARAKVALQSTRIE